MRGIPDSCPGCSKVLTPMTVTLSGGEAECNNCGETIEVEDKINYKSPVEPEDADRDT